jgi:glutamate-1-semialdehyde 2,1-aminomutase
MAKENPMTGIIDPTRLKELTAKESDRLDAKLVRSREMYGKAREHLCNGVASSYQLRDPWPIYVDHGEGSRVWDVDGNEYYDFHNGFGAMVQGHANPVIGEAVNKRFAKGTHFALPDEDDFVVAGELSERFGLPKWRYTNSGSESTMDAIRIARAYTHRDPIMKIFGSYHGHHDAVMISIAEDYDKIGDRLHLRSLPYGAGIPAATIPLTVPVPFNDAEALEHRIVEMEGEGNAPACLIMEACLMNMSIVPPEPGYLEAVRDITTRHGMVLIFDEVKTGLTIGPGGATKLFGVRPDMVTMAKALGGGLPMGAIGGTEEVMSVVESGEVYQVGTYSGNPLCVAAARANLEKVLTPDAYDHFDHLNKRLMDGCTEVVHRYGFPGYAVGFGAKGCVTFSPHKIVDYVTFRQGQRSDLNQLCWLYAMNRGVFMTPGREEEWTLSVAHDDKACDAYINAFAEMAHDLMSD